MKEFGGIRRSRFGSFIVDERGTLLGLDEAMEELTGWSAFELVGQSHGAFGEATEYTGSAEVADRGDVLYEGTIPPLRRPNHRQLVVHCKDGRTIEVEALVRPLEGPGDRLLVTALGVLQRSGPDGEKATPKNLDPLTELRNHRDFHKQLEEDFENAEVDARPLSVILLDVDKLREINDHMGNGAGDDVLRKIAGILRVLVNDELRIARLGEDDFAIILTEGGRGEARQLAASLRSNIERFRFFEGGEPSRRPQVTVSIGTASFPADADTDRELFERAQDAVDEARSMGRNRVWCYLRRPRVPVQVPVYFDATKRMLVGYSRDISPSGIFVQTTAGIDVGMRCALAFELPEGGHVHVVGRVVRTVQPGMGEDPGDVRIPGLGVEFERFGGTDDRHALDAFLHGRESTTLRPEDGTLSL